MPKKNSKAKKSRIKKSAIKKDIAKAVERIPGMIAEEMHMISNDQPVSQTTTVSAFYIQPNRSRLLLWIGVGTVTLAIFAMWIVNAKAMFYDIQHTKSVEGGLFADAKDDIDTIFSGGPEKPVTPAPVEPQKTNSTETEQAVKQTLQAIFASTSTTTISNTEDSQKKTAE